MRTHALCLVLLAASIGRAPAALAREVGEPPAGSPEDRALWSGLRNAAGEAEHAMARVAQCAYRLRYGGYREGLEALAKAEPAGRAEGARRLREELDRVAGAAQSAIPPDGGRVRECRYTLLYLEQRMDQPPENPMTLELPEIRADAGRCVERLVKLTSAVRPEADALEAKMAEIDRFLGRVGGATPVEAGK